MSLGDRIRYSRPARFLWCMWHFGPSQARWMVYQDGAYNAVQEVLAALEKTKPCEHTDVLTADGRAWCDDCGARWYDYTSLPDDEKYDIFNDDEEGDDQ